METKQDYDRARAQFIRGYHPMSPVAKQIIGKWSREEIEQEIISRKWDISLFEDGAMKGYRSGYDGTVLLCGYTWDEVALRLWLSKP